LLIIELLVVALKDKRRMIDVNLDANDQCEDAMWLTASEALARLGSKPQTLYANVSRGRIAAKPDPEDSRRSLYSAEDVDRLAKRARGRRSAEAVASDAVRWGDPVFPSAVSTIVAGRLYYRGKDAVELSRTGRLENVATLLWGGDWHESSPSAQAVEPGGIPGALAALAARAGRDSPSYGRSEQVLRPEAGSILMTMAGALTGPLTGSLHSRLAHLWGRPEIKDCLRRALVLLADHELNASTFAARVAVSTGSSLAAGTLAGLAALSGPLHGDASTGVFALIERVRAVGAGEAVREWLGQGRPVPAFGHRLYPGGDIRAIELLGRLELPAAYRDLQEAVADHAGEQPNIDFALAALTDIHHLPKEAPITIFALARTVGWLAHLLEQVASGQLIRPRARYVGPPVSVPDARQTQV
jgi:citrate synthase